LTTFRCQSIEYFVWFRFVASARIGRVGFSAGSWQAAAAAAEETARYH